jgi:hypothetical protein
MTDKQLFKLALDALEKLFGIPDKWTGEGGGDVAVWRLGGSYRAQQAITALKERLTQPAQRTWVGLTDEEIHNLDPLPHRMFDTQRIEFARAIEAKLKDKNTPQRTEQNFCSRCGKRTPDLITIHTCTPPKEGA